MNNHALYDKVSKYFVIAQVVGSTGSFFTNAQFGRFAPESRFLTFDGIKSWIFMELFSPATFVATFLRAPLSSASDHAPVSHTAKFFAGLFLTHYTNRAIISPLRSPSRSRMHISVTISAVAFNLCNGFLLGAYFSSPEGNFNLRGALSKWTFWTGIALWCIGFVGNIVHDEVLLNIRRKQKRKAKQAEGKNDGKEYYGIPFEYLFQYVSFPNYFFEWIEWFGFALAASPNNFYTPPWLFFTAEILTMAPRAWRGHQWYHKKFPEYPKERKVVIPFVF